MQKHSLAHHERTRRIRAKRVDRMMGVMSVESTDDDFPEIDLVVSIGIAKQDQIWLLRNINSLGSKFESDRQVQFVSEDGFLISPSILIGIFVN